VAIDGLAATILLVRLDRPDLLWIDPAAFLILILCVNYFLFSMEPTK